VTRRRTREERGSLSVEMAMIAPALLGLFAIIFAYGQVGQVNGLLDSGARDGARSATVARSLDQAREVSLSAVREAVKDAPKDCQDSLQVRIVGDYTPGEPITVDADCTYGLSQIGLPGAPGTIHAHASFTSMLDPNRGLE
jgi:hypothetical protein